MWYKKYKKEKTAFLTTKGRLYTKGKGGNFYPLYSVVGLFRVLCFPFPFPFPFATTPSNIHHKNPSPIGYATLKSYYKNPENDPSILG